MTRKEEGDMVLISNMSSSSCLSSEEEDHAEDAPQDDLVPDPSDEAEACSESTSTCQTSTSVTMTPDSHFFVSSSTTTTTTTTTPTHEDHKEEEDGLVESPLTIDPKDNHDLSQLGGGSPLPSLDGALAFGDSMDGLDRRQGEMHPDHDDESSRQRDKPRSPSVGEYGQIEHLDDDEEDVEPLAASSPSHSSSNSNSSSSQPQPQAQPHLDEQHHHFHLLRQIREDAISDGSEEDVISISSDSHEKQQQQRVVPLPLVPPMSLSSTHPLVTQTTTTTNDQNNQFDPYYSTTHVIYEISKRCFMQEDFCHATWIGFWALLVVTCANYVLTPMRDAVALQVGVQHMPKLTLMSSGMAFLSSVPIGWLFEAPDPQRRNVWKKMGFSRGETQGTSLALFYRCFALSLLFYAVGFVMVDWYRASTTTTSNDKQDPTDADLFLTYLWSWIPYLLSQLGHVMYIAFFLVVHLMKLHSLSLVWGVTTEAMEYEDVARNAQHTANNITLPPKKTRTRLQRLSLVGFGGTLGGILGRYVNNENEDMPSPVPHTHTHMRIVWIYWLSHTFCLFCFGYYLR